MSMRYMDLLSWVTEQSLSVIREKTRTYGDSWKRRGGVGAWFTIVRPWDRLESQVRSHSHDIITACLSDTSGADGTALASVRDLTNYLILVQAEVEARRTVTLHVQESQSRSRSLFAGRRFDTDGYPVPGTPEDGGHHASAEDVESSVDDPRAADEARVEAALTRFLDRFYLTSLDRTAERDTWRLYIRAALGL